MSRKRFVENEISHTEADVFVLPENRTEEGLHILAFLFEERVIAATTCAIDSRAIPIRRLFIEALVQWVDILVQMLSQTKILE